MSEAKTGWTKDVPTLNGWYWVKDDKTGPVLTEALNGCFYIHSSRYMPELNDEWLGPISPLDLEELTRLREWKESAMTLLARYDSIAETFGGKLGSSKIDNLERGVKQLRAENKDLPPKGYWPTLVDRGDGVPGHFCIGQLIKPDKPYWEFWNNGQWTSAGEVFVGREAAQNQLDAIRVGDEIDLLDNDAVDQELYRWQEAIRNKLIDLGAPDWKIDGAGCDGGDPLDFTLAEVGQGCGYFIDQVESLQSQLEQLRAEVERLKSKRMIVREDAERFIKQYLHSAQWEGETLMITFENEALIAALIGDVEKL